MSYIIKYCDGVEYIKTIDVLIKRVLKKAGIKTNGEIKVLYWDLDRTDIEINGNEYSIRTWEIHETPKCLYIRWTLFLMVDDGDGLGHGEPILESISSLIKFSEIKD